MDKIITEGNKLIAVFKGDKICGILETGSNPLRAFYEPDKIDVFENKGYQAQLNYHTSWDWLMPVVEKIESFGFNVEIKDTACWIDKYGENDIIAGNRIEGTKKESVWLSVVEFIKWYNQKL